MRLLSIAWGFTRLLRHNALLHNALLHNTRPQRYATMRAPQLSLTTVE
jgi:hypothetical protein